MTEYAPSAELGLILPIPETGQQWSTQKYIVDNFNKVDVRAASTRGRLEKLEQYRGGTTVERGAFYGVDPTTPTDRAAFANTFPMWFNEDKGYWQQYFCQFDDPGAVASTPAKTTAGWGAAMHLGLVPLKPASVAAAAGTAVLHGGKVVFTAATTLSLNGIFSADFENYLVRLHINSVSVTGGGGIRLRAAGVDAASADYHQELLWAQAAAVSASSQSAQTSAAFAAVSGQDGLIEIELSGVGLARATQIDVENSSSLSPSTMAKTFIAAKHNLTTAYDGLTVLPSAGNMTGVLQAYGINDY